MDLNAGALKVLYENGFLRYLKIGKTEVIRMIYFAVRDQNWKTIGGVISNEIINQTENSFHITYLKTSISDDIKIEWKVSITGSADETISFSIDGTANKSFLKDRVGICVLHPIRGTAGQACSLEHTNGNFSIELFPEFISPHQPFKNIKSMQWIAGKKSEVRLNFSGEIFETEDQRNWTDASYKTYCTPLDLPFPAYVEEGQMFSQNVTFSVIQKGFIADSHLEDEIFFDLRGTPLPFPYVGIGMNAEMRKLQSAEIDFLKSIGLNHLRAEIHLDNPKWHVQVEDAFAQSALLEVPLELALFFSLNPVDDLPWIVEYLQNSPFGIVSIILYEAKSRRTTDSLVHTVISSFRYYFPGTKLGGGSDANFVELNRNRIDDRELDFVVYAMNPQVHATDNLTLIENMQGQSYSVNTAQNFTENKEIHISPVTLKPRFSAAVSLPAHENLPVSDPRQPTAFIAGWVLGSLKYLAEAGVTSITFFETTGDRGVCSNHDIYAVGNLLKIILQFRAEFVLTITSNYPLKISGFLLQNKHKKLLLLANHTQNEQSVLLPGNFKAETYQLISTHQPGLNEKLTSESSRFVSLQPESVLVLEGF